jgi:hypothetical protein
MGPALQVSTTNACNPEENPLNRFANSKNLYIFTVTVYINSVLPVSGRTRRVSAC